MRIAASLACVLLLGDAAWAGEAEHRRAHLRDPDPARLLQQLHPDAQPSWLGLPTLTPHGVLTREHHPRLHDGARVFDQDLLLFQQGGQVRRALGHLRPVRLNAERTLTTQEATEIALALHPGSVVRSTEALLVPRGDGYDPVEAVRLGLASGLFRTLWIDADDTPGVRREIDPLQHDTYEGTVQVYDANVDSGPLVIRDVHDLAYEEWLRAELLHVVDYNHTEPTPYLRDEDAEFHYDPEDRRFSIAMGFYHLQNGQRFFVERSGGLFEGLEILEVAYVNIGSDNDLGDPGLAVSAGHILVEDDDPVHIYLLGDGDLYDQEMGNFSHDAEVWLHEQGHGVTGEVTPFLDHEMRAEDEEFDALHEGLSDYGAAAYTGNTRVLAWVAADFPEAHRPIDEPMHLDEFESGEDEHHNGMIIGTLGWRIRERTGPDAADAIVFGSRHYLSASDAGFSALTEGMLMADEDLHGGRYAVPILQSLEAHGLSPVDFTWGADVEPERSGPVRKGQPITLDSGPIPSAVGYAWQVLDAPEDSEFTEVTGEDRWNRELGFTPDVCGIWTLELVLSNDDWQLSEPAIVEVATCGAGCGCDSTVIRGASAGSLGLVLIGAGLLARRRRGRTGRRAIRPGVCALRRA